jgi:FkbM family methyltransferase
MTSMRGFAMPRIRRLVKRYVPARHRHWVGVQLRELRLQRNAIRNGVSPVSVLRHRLLGQLDSLRFKGVRVRTTDPRATQDVARDIWCHGEYDVPGYSPQPGWRIVDIGGNVGLFAMHAASRGARVVSYEPHPQAAACFRANTSRWGVELHQAAVVGTGAGRPMRLYSNPDRDIRHTLTGRDVKTGEPLQDGIDVPTVSLADVLAEPCDLLKVDCEGGEFDIFCNGGDALRNAERIIAEIHLNAGDVQEAVRAVEAAGFVTELRDPEHPSTPYVQLIARRG